MSQDQALLHRPARVEGSEVKLATCENCGGCTLAHNIDYRHIAASSTYTPIYCAPCRCSGTTQTASGDYVHHSGHDAYLNRIAAALENANKLKQMELEKIDALIDMNRELLLIRKADAAYDVAIRDAQQRGWDRQRDNAITELRDHGYKVLEPDKGDD